jgi:cyclopropane fatty-acyl-phospholipid synthase-like methyltransferase
MSTGNSWAEFFDAHAPVYDDNVFTQDTAAEIDFLLEELDLPPGARVLDLGCGTGRHSVALAQRGYHATGVDLSSGMLARAQAKADEAGVSVEWVHCDATRYTSPTPFDAVICLCEGAFGLLGAGDDAVEHPLAVLRTVSHCLRPGGQALFTVLNACRLIRQYDQEAVDQGRFDPLTLTESSEAAPTEGHPPLSVRERAFVPTELALLFRLAGLTVRGMWGGTAGDWGHRPLKLDEYEIMVLASRPA